jgi:hypothetical protein
MPTTDTGKDTLFTHFAAVFSAKAASLGFSAAEAAAQAADAAYFHAVLGSQGVMISSGEEWTSWKDILRDGGAAPAVLPTFPVAPASLPAAVAPGLLGRFQALVKRVKAAPGYTEAIGDSLGIIGAEITPVDPAATAPDLALSLNGGRVEIGWSKSSFDAIEIEVDRGAGFAMLTIDTTPDTIDTSPLPATPTAWKYRAIYREDNARFGQWSKVASITVGV